jgi:polysaccharide biosynthesis transport protein
LLREMIKQGRTLEISEVANNELIRRLSEQRATLSAQMALEGRALLPQHPRMKELVAQLADLDSQIRLAAEKTVRGLENDARIAGSRVDGVNAALDEQKKTSSEGNEKEVELRALEREAKAARDQLEAYMGKYREAVARQSDDKGVPPDARVMSRALVPATPSFPRKIPIISIATLGTLVLAIAGVVAKELVFSATSQRPAPALAHEAEAVIPKRRAEPLDEGAEPRADGQQGEEPALVAGPSGAEQESPSSQTMSRPTDPDKVEPGARGVEPDQARAASPSERESSVATSSGTRTIEATEVADIADHLISLKPDGRAIIVLVSRASESDQSPSFSLPLARDIAQGARTILVDLDGRARCLSRETGFADAPGLGELMANRIGFSEAIHRDLHSNLHLVPAGTAESRSEGTSSEDLSLVLQALARTYDAVLVDSRPVGDPAVLRALVADVDVALVVRGAADEAAMAAALVRFAAEQPSLLLAVEPAANDDRPPSAFAAA